MDSNITKAKLNAREFIENLQVLYGEKFSKMHGEISQKKLEVWRNAIGGFDESVGKIVLQRILDDKTKYTANVPTLPQLKSLLNEVYFEFNNNARSKRIQGAISIGGGASIDLLKSRDTEDDRAIKNKFGDEELVRVRSLKGREYCFERLDLLSKINHKLIPFVKILRKNENVEAF